MVNTFGVILLMEPGDLFYELFGGEEDEYVCLTKPVRNESGYWTWTARPSCGVGEPDVVDFGAHEEYLQFAPQISFKSWNH